MKKISQSMTKANAKGEIVLDQTLRNTLKAELMAHEFPEYVKGANGDYYCPLFEDTDGNIIHARVSLSLTLDGVDKAIARTRKSVAKPKETTSFGGVFSE